MCVFRAQTTLYYVIVVNIRNQYCHLQRKELLLLLFCICFVGNLNFNYVSGDFQAKLSSEIPFCLPKYRKKSLSREKLQCDLFHEIFAINQTKQNSAIFLYCNRETLRCSQISKTTFRLCKTANLSKNVTLYYELDRKIT